MSNKNLQEKVAYFKEQELLNLSDDENGIPDEGYLKAERALANSKSMPPPKSGAQRSSFGRPTPKQGEILLQAHSSKPHVDKRSDSAVLTRSATAPEPGVTKKYRQRPSFPSDDRPTKKLKKTSSMLVPKAQNDGPFYKRVGVVPRELKNGRNVKLANHITLEPEQKQLLRGKVIYFYPPDDISMVRRQRIHKIIQLGAAWVTVWRDDITHVMVDDSNSNYAQLLRHFSKDDFPHDVNIVKFEPYIPQCIQLGTLLDTTATRFLVKDAPQHTLTESSLPRDSQTSLQIKPSPAQLAAKSSHKTDSVPTEDTAPQSSNEQPLNTNEEVVKDSFYHSTSFPKGNEAEITDPCNDALSAAIKETRALAHLPLEDEDDGDSRPSSSSSPGYQGLDAGTDDEAIDPSIRHPQSSISIFAAPKHKGGINQNAFQCMNPVGTSSLPNPNARTIEVLIQMCKYYDQMQDHWRTFSYRRAITTLRKQAHKVTTAKEASALPFIGSRLADKIEEIVITDRLRRLDSTRDDPTDTLLRLFLGVYGAGISQANKWIQAGHRTLDDLRANARLTESQKIGVEHYDDFASRIPRKEVEEHGEFVKTALHRIDGDFECTVMGSYRRGAQDSGDIDIIITKPGAPLTYLREIVFRRLVPDLFKLTFLKAKLAASSKTEDGTKWHGASCLPSSTIWRRLDLLLVPEHEVGAALLYFTGNDIFNRSMRLLASKKGMRLNQRGLFKDVVRGKHREKLNEGTLVESKNEKRIFEILGVPWREPTERIC